MKKIQKAFHAVTNVYCKIEMAFLIIFTMVIGALIILEIIRRMLGITGLKWIEEMGRYMLVTTTLVGCSVAVKNKGHAVMDLFYTFMSDKVAFAFQIVVNLLCGALFLYIGAYSVIWTKELIVLKRSMESVTAPLWPVWVIVSLAFLSTGIRFLIEVKNCALKLKRGEAFNEITQKEM